MSTVMDDAATLVDGLTHVGQLVRRERTQRGLSQVALAARIGMSSGDLSLLESGRKFVVRATVSSLGPLAEALEPDDAAERGRLLRAMLLLSGMERNHLEAVLGFEVAMSRSAEPMLAGAAAW